MSTYLLVWDAPNMDMGLGSLLGGRPTAAHRPRFDAVGKWLIDEAEARADERAVDDAVDRPVERTAPEHEDEEDAETLGELLDERRLPDALALLASLRDRWPALRVLVAFQALAGDDLRALLAAGADAFRQHFGG